MASMMDLSLTKTFESSPHHHWRKTSFEFPVPRVSGQKLVPEEKKNHSALVTKMIRADPGAQCVVTSLHIGFSF